jgi:hypothetical protein
MTSKVYVPPDWVYKIVNRKKKELLRDTVYNIYRCGCLLIHKDDMNRQSRFIQKKVNDKPKNYLICNCKNKDLFECKVKICSVCGDVLIGKKQKDGLCKVCNKKYGDQDICKLNDDGLQNTSKELLFFQNDKLYNKIPINPNFTQPNCKWRSHCLKQVVPISSNEAIVRIWCYKCPRYQNEFDL